MSYPNPTIDLTASSPVQIVLDLETTGRTPGNSSIIQIGAVAIVDNKILDGSFYSFSYPGNIIHWESKETKGAFRVNGITREQVQEAPADMVVAKQFEQWIAALSIDEAVSIHAYNNNFDRKFLLWYPWNIPLWAWGQCIMMESKRVMGPNNLKKRGAGYKHPSLKEAADYFGIEMHRAHDGLEDAKTAARILVEIQK